MRRRFGDVLGTVGESEAAVEAESDRINKNPENCSFSGLKTYFRQSQNCVLALPSKCFLNSLESEEFFSA